MANNCSDFALAFLVVTLMISIGNSSQGPQECDIEVTSDTKGLVQLKVVSDSIWTVNVTSPMSGGLNGSLMMRIMCNTGELVQSQCKKLPGPQNKHDWMNTSINSMNCCDGVSCGNGDCVWGTCDCPSIEWTGALCEIRDDPPTCLSGGSPSAGEPGSSGACPPPPTIPYTLRDSISTQPNAEINYFCPAHWVFSTTNQRYGVTATCVAGGTWQWNFEDSICIPATCSPSCQNGGVCRCSRTACQCDCVGPWVGTDCSINQTTIPELASLGLFYPMSDPHWILNTADPASSNPWAFDISANNFHGEIVGDAVLEPTDGPYSGKAHTSINFNASAASPPHIKATFSNVFDFYNNIYAVVVKYKALSNLADQPLLGFPTVENSSHFVVVNVSSAKIYGIGSNGCYGPVADVNWPESDMSVNDFSTYQVFYDRMVWHARFHAVQNTLSSTPINLGPVFDYDALGLTIGTRLDASCVGTCPNAAYLSGSMGAIGLWTGPALVAVNISVFDSFAATNIGAGSSYLTPTGQCTIAPPIGYGIPRVSYISDGWGGVSFQNQSLVTYKCLAPYFAEVSSSSRTNDFNCGENGIVEGIVDCQRISSGCIVDCINGGICVNNTCNCPNNYIGLDCSVNTNDRPNGAIAIWPMVADTTYGLDIDAVISTDYSGNDFHLAVGTGVMFADGPYYTEDGAYTIQSSRANSSLAQWSALTSQTFANYTTQRPSSTIIEIYMFINVKQIGVGVPDQPLLVWTTDSVHAVRGMAFFIEGASGSLLFYRFNGTSVTIPGVSVAADVWTFLRIKLNFESSEVLAATGEDSFSGVTNIQLTSGNYTANNFHIGYTDYPPGGEYTANIKVSCIGFYENPAGVTPLFYQHVEMCQKFHKPTCSIINHYSKVHTVLTPSMVYGGSNVTVKCLPHYQAVSIQAAACQPSTDFPFPTFEYSSYYLNCTESLTCPGNCTGNGVCVPLSPVSYCTCYTGFYGTDCSIQEEALPAFESANAFYPLTLKHINKNRYFINFLESGNNGTMAWVDESLDFQPKAGTVKTAHVPDFTFSSSGIYWTSYSGLSLAASFTISVYCYFHPSSITVNLYPILNLQSMGNTTFTLFLSPSGVASFFTGDGNYYHYTFGHSINTEQWYFVSFYYNGSQFSVGLDSASVTGNSTAAVYNVAQLYSNGIVGEATYVPPNEDDYDYKFRGSLACLSVYSGILSTQEISSLQAVCDDILDELPVLAPTTTTTTTTSTTTTSTPTTSTTTTTTTTTSTPVPTKPAMATVPPGCTGIYRFFSACWNALV